MSDETSTLDPNEQLSFNGINGDTGSYLTPRLTVDELAGLAQGKSLEEVRQTGSTDLDDLTEKIQDLSFPEIKQLARLLALSDEHRATSISDLVDQLAQGSDIDPEVESFAGELDFKGQEPFPLIVGKDPGDLRQTGWGVIFARSLDPAVKDALRPLLDFRKQQVLENNDNPNKAKLYRELSHRGESKSEFLERYGIGPGPVDPDMGMPYYLLLVGDPEQIPYRFQYQLDVQFAVGRIWFDTPEEYHHYAESVVRAESGTFTLPRRAIFFGVRNADDKATQLSADHLVAPLAATLQQEDPAWRIDTIIGEQATKKRLAEVLSSDPPALLFTASHGMGFERGSERQVDDQGALLCQDWPGPVKWRYSIPKEFYFSADDITDDVSLTGMIAFFFACYGAGTPEFDEFAYQKGKRESIAPKPFLARLPRKLLSHPNGGALAVVGHVERAWGYSFYWGKAGKQIQVFVDTLKRLMPLQGDRIGYAYEQFNIRYAELASDLSNRLQELHLAASEDERPSAMDLAQDWTASNDARGYVILGDPAVKLPIGDVTSVQGQRGVRPAATATLSASPPVSETTAATAATALYDEPDDSVTRGGFTVAAAVEEPVDYAPRGGWFGGGGRDKEETAEQQELEHAETGLKESITEVASKLVEALKKAIDDAASLEVKTYVSKDLSRVEYRGREAVGNVQLRAVTRISIDGDMTGVVPQTEDGEIDREILEIHNEMVERAQQNRNELIKTVSSVATGLVEALKVL